MHLKIALLTQSLTLPTSSIASEAGNILACINAVKAYTGKVVDEFDVNYTGRFFNYSSAEWTGIKCEVLLDTVHSLKVDGKLYIVDGFAGYPAKRAYETMEKETDDAISLLESRIALLQRRLDQSEQKLKQQHPDISEIQLYITTNIGRATDRARVKTSVVAAS